MRWLFRLIGVMVVLVAVLVVSVLFLPADRLGRLAADQLSRQLGREVQMGAVDLTLWPVLGLDVQDLRLANADWAGDAPLLQAARATVGLNPLTALQGRVDISSLTIDAPVIRLVQDDQGRANWDFTTDHARAPVPADPGAESAAGAPAATGPDLSLGPVTITNADLRRSAPDGTQTVTLVRLELDWPDMAGTGRAQVEQLALASDGALGTQQLLAETAQAVWQGLPGPAELSLTGVDLRSSGAAGRQTLTAATLQAAWSDPMAPRRAQLTGADLRHDGPGGAQRLRVDTLALDWPFADGPARLTGRVAPFEDMLDIALDLADPRALMAGDSAPLALALQAPGGSLRFDGTASAAPRLQGTLDADMPQTARFAAALGVAGLDLPRGAGRALRAKGQIGFDEDRLTLRDMALALDDNALALRADLSLAGKPRLEARISAGALDLTGLTEGDPKSGGAGQGGGGASPVTGWPTDAIDASALGLADADIRLTADSIDLGSLKLGETDLGLTIDRARAVFALNDVAAYGGTAAGQFVMNNRSGLSVGGDLRLAQIQLQPALSDLAGVDRLSGDVGVQLEFLGVGQSVDAIMRSLRGSGRISGGPGVIEGLSLAAALQGGGVEGGTTIFNTLDASFQVSDGVLRNEDLAMDLPVLRAEGAGLVDLGKRRLDYVLAVVSDDARDGRGLSIPVRLKGPWDDPAIRVDPGEVLNRNLEREKQELEQRLQDERDRLEREARDRIAREAEERLGITLQEGQAPEDALRDALEDRAIEGLRRLFE